MGVITQMVDLYTNMAASVQPVSDSVKFYYAQRGIEIKNTIYVAGNVPLQIGDLITDDVNTYVLKGWRNQAGRNVLTAFDVDYYTP